MKVEGNSKVDVEHTEDRFWYNIKSTGHESIQVNNEIHLFESMGMTTLTDLTKDIEDIMPQDLV